MYENFAFLVDLQENYDIIKSGSLYINNNAKER